jgi:hypothetical protein
MSTQIFFTIFLFLVILIYVKYSLSYNDTSTIVRKFLDQVNSDDVFMKLPILLQDKIVSPLQLMNTVFNYLYIYRENVKVKSNIWVRCRAKYTIVYNNGATCLIKLLHPTKKHEEQLYIQQNNCIILPSWWYYQCNTDKVDVINLYDSWMFVISKFYSQYCHNDQISHEKL